MTGAGEYFWLKTIVFFLSDLFEHCKNALFEKRCLDIPLCAVCKLSPFIMFAKYVYGWIFSGKKSGVVFYAKETVWWLCKQGFFLRAASRYLFV